MDLRQLEYFQMASRFKSISKAAEQLNVAQPSVSIAIQKLEEELGVQLFDRSQRQIILTAEGILFSQRVNEILTRIQESVTEMNDLRLLQKGAIRIGIPPMIGSFLFPNIFAQFQQHYPLLELKAIEGGSLSIQKLLEQGKLDVGIISTSASISALEFRPITTSQILVCLNPGHPLTKLASIPFSQLKGQPLIMLKEDTYVRHLIQTECAKHHFAPTIVFSSVQIGTIIGLIEQGTGISLLFDAIARKHTTIEIRPLVKPLYCEIVLVWNPKRYLSNATKAFIDFITKLYPSPLPTDQSTRFSKLK